MAVRGSAKFYAEVFSCSCCAFVLEVQITMVCLRQAVPRCTASCTALWKQHEEHGTSYEKTYEKIRDGCVRSAGERAACGVRMEWCETSRRIFVVLKWEAKLPTVSKFLTGCTVTLHAKTLPHALPHASNTFSCIVRVFKKANRLETRKGASGWAVHILDVHCCWCVVMYNTVTTHSYACGARYCGGL